jgi:hypothetical protein
MAKGKEKGCRHVKKCRLTIARHRWHKAGGIRFHYTSLPVRTLMRQTNVPTVLSCAST